MNTCLSELSACSESSEAESLHPSVSPSVSGSRAAHLIFRTFPRTRSYISLFVRLLCVAVLLVLKPRKVEEKRLRLLTEACSAPDPFGWTIRCPARISG